MGVLGLEGRGSGMGSVRHFYSFLLFSLTKPNFLPYLIIFLASDTKKFQIPKTLVQTQSGDVM